MEARRSFVWRGSSQSFRGLRRRPKLATLSLSLYLLQTHSLTYSGPLSASTRSVSLLGRRSTKDLYAFSGNPSALRCRQAIPSGIATTPPSNPESPFNPRAAPRRLQSASRAGPADATAQCPWRTHARLAIAETCGLVKPPN